MMATTLTLAPNGGAVGGLAAATGNRRFAYDSYRRLIQMYGDTVDGIDGHRFEQELGALKGERGADQDVELSADDLAELVGRFKRIYEDETGRPFAQDAGEQLVAGIRTPEPIARMQDGLPEAYEQFLQTAQRLEEHYRDMQDIEFTVEEGKLYLLQTRTAKRTAAAAPKAAADMVEEGLITREEAVARIDPAQ